VTSNPNAVDNLHNQLNAYFNTRVNPNWRAIVDAIGQSDQDVATLIEEVRKQFFISTAHRPYIDRLAANYNVSRPKVIGMDDVTLQKYVPILAYQPKQVKSIIDQLLDVFFFKEYTTAFAQSLTAGPYSMKDGWELQYTIDGSNIEQIVFHDADFVDPTAATAQEIVSVINRQANYSFAVIFTDNITKSNYIRIFTNTIGSKGSVQINGGRGDIALAFYGLILTAGSGTDTRWVITTVGDTVTFTYVGGAAINLYEVAVGNSVIIDMPGNSGTFTITAVDVSANSFQFQNLSATSGSFDHGANPGYYVRFMVPQRFVIYERDNRAIVWETHPGEITIEMPSTPPVFRRPLVGAAHLNGLSTTMTGRISDTSIVVSDASEWPNAGRIVIRAADQIDNRIYPDTPSSVVSLSINTNFDAKSSVYEYSSKTQISGGWQLNDISPSLPNAAGVLDLTIASASSDSSGILTMTTSEPHGLIIGGSFRVYGSTASTLNAVYQVSEVVNAHTVISSSNTVSLPLTNNGNVVVERVGLADSGSQVYLTSAIVNTGLFGPYMWDAAASFVLSSYVGTLSQSIDIGSIVLNLSVNTPNNIPSEQGYLIFDYGLETQEGPVRYLYKASEGVIALDPSYIFKYAHAINGSITAIRRKGAHVLSGIGTEYPFYVSDPSQAILILQDLISQVKSAGIFIEYIIRYPQVFYSDLDTYSKTTKNKILLGL
jgi:hypothetical protein